MLILCRKDFWENLWEVFFVREITLPVLLFNGDQLGRGLMDLNAQLSVCGGSLIHLVNSVFFQEGVDATFQHAEIPKVEVDHQVLFYEIQLLQEIEKRR